jgi:(p)ppGpp synthase/HD superfamily hydrolase
MKRSKIARMEGRRRLPAFVQRLPITADALEYAERRHAGQTRDADGAAFIEHPLEVATLLYESGAPDHVVAVGVLHDTLEKTDAVAAELQPRFGDRITSLVLAVTEDDSIGDFATRKSALLTQVEHAGPEALMVFAADKVSKVRELRLQALSSRAAGSRSYARYLAHYRDCLRMLEGRMPESRLVTMLRAELETSGGAMLGVPSMSPSS